MQQLLLQQETKDINLFILMVLQQTLELLKLALGEANEVTLTGTETLTNKTLTAPKIGTSILDTNGRLSF